MDPHTEKTMGIPVVTADGTMSLHHPGYCEEYHSKFGARAEAEDLYMDASGFAAHLAASFTPITVLDVGLGLGYNALATVSRWINCRSAPPLNLVSLENNGALPSALASGAAPWMNGWSEDWRTFVQALNRLNDTRWTAAIVHPSTGATLQWTIIVGDATTTPFTSLPPVDFVWQDAFSPKRNPEMWTSEWFGRMGAAASPAAILVTYSVARLVRDNLTAADWNCYKIPAGGSKRSWLKATRTPPISLSTT